MFYNFLLLFAESETFVPFCRDMLRRDQSKMASEMSSNYFTVTKGKPWVDLFAIVFYVRLTCNVLIPMSLFSRCLVFRKLKITLHSVVMFF